MNANRIKRPWMPLIVLSICLIFLGVNGFIGGYLMLSDPYGAPMGMPVSVLQSTLFHNFIIPGIFLIVVWGAGSFIVLLGLWLHPQKPAFDLVTRWTREHWAWTLCVGLGMGLLIWLTYQVFTLPEIAPVQFILYALAILAVAIPLLPGMRAYYRLRNAADVFSIRVTY